MLSALHLSFILLPLPSWITACLRCVSKRRAEWQKEGSQRLSFPALRHGWSSVAWPCDPHTSLWPFALVRSSTSWLASNLAGFFLFFNAISFFKKISLGSELTMGLCEAWKYLVIFQRNHSYIWVHFCTCVRWHACISTEESVAKMVDQPNSLNIYWGCLVSFCLVISFNLSVLVDSLI